MTNLLPILVNQHTKFRDEGIFCLAGHHNNKRDLTELWRWVRRSNQGATLPYHGNLHLSLVTGMAYVLACDEGADLGVCMVAAMLHDYDHRGPLAKSDRENIAEAIKAVAWAENVSMIPRSIDYDHVVHTIEATRYEKEGGFMVEPTTPEQRVLRDADVWHIHMPVTLGLLMTINLGTELSRWDASNYRDSLGAQQDFYAGLTWFTQRGQALQHLVAGRVLDWANPDEEHVWVPELEIE